MNVRVVGGDAGQSEDLIARLRGLVREYPAGIGIIKEFLQNADDAGATRVRFVLDLRQHSSESLPDQRMAALMGPALIVESDQAFSHEDLENIQKIGNAGKAREGGKTGRFGLGFNTSYNLTDYPAFATNDRIICFDPHRDAVAQESGRPGRYWILADLWQTASDWPIAFGIERGANSLGRRTIFRLPLRLATQASDVRISAHPFPASDVEQIFDDLSSWGSSLLIFLRSVLHTYAVVIRPDGTVENRAEIETENVTDVLEHRKHLSDIRQGATADLVYRLEQQCGSLPRSVYPHTFRLRSKGRQRTETWLISQGLFLSHGGEVSAAIKEMLAIGEKAIPMGGAAVRIELTDSGDIRPVRTRGRLYCSLPLPSHGPLPIHINAFFDLDASRSQITHVDAVGDTGVRVKWNRVLLQHAVAPSVAMLFEHLSTAVNPADYDKYYRLWPENQKLTGALAPLANHLYAELGRRPLFRVASGSEFVNLVSLKTRIPARGWSARLISALRADGLSLPEPSLPTHILQGLRDVSMEPKLWNPAEIGQWLRVTKDLACPVAKAPRICLRRRETIVELLKFCGEGNAENLTGLPLALMADGTLRAFGRETNIFLGDEATRSLFNERPRWFLDNHLQKCNVVQASPALCVYNMDATHAIYNLRSYLGESEGALKWTSNGEKAPNEAWLTELYRWLASLKDLPTRVEALRKVPIVPDGCGSLWRPGSISTPLLPDEGTATDLRDALKLFGVPIVTGGAELLLAVRTLVAKCSGLIYRITRADVIDALAALENPGIDLPVTCKERLTLLRWLSEQDGGTPLDSERIQKIIKLKMWPTESGELVAIDEHRAYLSTGYQPPSLFAGATLLRREHSGAWRALLLGMGVPELDLPSFLSRFFLPGYSALSLERQREALRWLRDEGWPALAGESTAKTKMREELRNAALIRGADGQQHRCLGLYHPASTDALSLLGSIAVVPDVAEFYSDDPDSWLSFFEKLGIWKQPRALDLLARINLLLRDVVDTDATDVALLKILTHVDERWLQLSDVMQKVLSNGLRDKEWIPVEMVAPEDAAGFKQPSRRYQRPSAVYPRRTMYLACSQVALLGRAAEPRREFRSAMGMPGDVSPQVAIAHFEYVRSLWQEEGHDEISPLAVERMCSETYRYLGARLQAEGVSDLFEALRPTECIWDSKHQTFRHPRHTFSEPVPYFGSFRACVRAQGLEDEGLRALGRRRTPEPADFAEFLQNLPTLDMLNAVDDQLAQMVLYAWRQLEAVEDTGILRPELLALTKDGRLMPVHCVIVNDAPWWHHRLVESKLPWAHPDQDAHTLNAAGAISTSESVEEVCIVCAEEATEEVRRWCEDRNKHLRSDAMIAGMIRLVAHVHGISGDQIDIDDLRDKLSVHLVPVAELQTGLLCRTFGLNVPIGEELVPCLLEGEGARARILISTIDEDAVVPALAEALNRRLGKAMSLTDLAPLEAILKCAGKDIQQRLDSRRIRRMHVASTSDFSWRTDDSAEPLVEYVQDHVGDDSAALEENPADAKDENNEGPHFVESKRAGSLGGNTIIGVDQELKYSNGSSLAHSAASRGSAQPSDVVETTSSELGRPQAVQAPSEDRPPLIPHEGRASSVPPKGRGRVVTYLGSIDEAIHGTRDGRSDANRIVELAALAVVEREERGSTIQHMDEPNGERNKGFDLKIAVAGEEESRIVEVKGLTSDWDSRGVSLTHSEFEAAQQYRKRHWLYVVERALEPTATLYRINDLASKVTEFRLDLGWKNFAQSIAKQPVPVVGHILATNVGERIGVIRSIVLRGLAIQLDVEESGGKIHRLTFNPVRHTILPAN